MASSSVQTFGVELELLVFYTTYSRPLPAEEIRRYGPVIKCPFCMDIVLPPGIAPKYPNFDKLPGAWVRQKVADVISEAGFKARSSWRAKGHEPDLFDYWNVVPDISLKINEDFEFAYSPLQAVGVEINSPVLVAGEEAFNEVLTVVKAINSAFRTAVPPMCGLHIHVGRGREALTLRTVQRSASLLWLAGNLIETLHPRSRLNNRHCLGIEKCNLSTGMTAKEAAGDWKLGKRQHVKLSLDRVDKDRKKPTHYQYTPPATLPNYPGSTLSLAVAREHGFRFEEPEHKEIPDVLDGVRSILRATDTGTIAELTGSTAHRGAYNFSNMARRAGEIPEGWIMPPWKTPDGEVIPSGWEDCPVESEPDTAVQRHTNKVIREAPRKPTIEFRQGAGSLDGEWIVIWAKICLALTGPAVVESSNDDFFQLLYNCVKAKEQPSEYDVFDLLHDIGISKEDLDAVYHPVL
ncbi:hypothetical protein NUW58_g2788 [Xylaria curta]|uniref:Uncharacterized protein n=1 Tax=Xylaria curta TaxID=42375 RepID=A0ACC1PFI1_9PEZI|nr:hypothetical protein NUW58_g2788 [Xylaria curta]